MIKSLLIISDSKDFKKFGDLFDDKFLKQFIRGKKYDTVKACEYVSMYLTYSNKCISVSVFFVMQLIFLTFFLIVQIQNYLYLRTDRFAEFSRTLRPSITPLINHGMLRMLKRSDQEGRIVVLDRVSKYIAL